MANIFKNIGRGIGYFFAFPGLLIAIAIYAVVGLIVFVYEFIKLIVLFFTGRTLFSDLKEDIELKAYLDRNKAQVNEQAQEKAEEPNPLSLYPSDSPVYGSGYSSPLFNKTEQEPDNVDVEYEEEPKEEGINND